MTLFEAFVLGALQGLTEFLPVSSSGHLVLAESFMKLDIQATKSFDIAMHFGTLLAIFFYFRKDIVNLWKAFWSFVFGKRGKAVSEAMQQDQKLVGYLVLATIPAIIVTLLFEKVMDSYFRHPLSIAIFTLIVGLGFFVIEFIAKKLTPQKVGLRQAIIVGLAQTLALMPGVSRSGITISAGLLQGIKREEAARFSFLLGSVAILAGTLYAVVEILRGKYPLPPTDVLIVGIVTSFAFGLGAISFLMRYLKNHTLNIFGVYRVILGLTMIYLIVIAKVL